MKIINITQKQEDIIIIIAAIMIIGAIIAESIAFMIMHC